MGKKINIEASDEPCMFQFFKKYIHQTDKNEFYCDNRVVDISNPNPGVVVDFKNIDHILPALEVRVNGFLPSAFSAGLKVNRFQ